MDMMGVIVKFGYRNYVLNEKDVTLARSIYAHNTGDLNDFEAEMNEAGIEFEMDAEMDWQLD